MINIRTVATGLSSGEQGGGYREGIRTFHLAPAVVHMLLFAAASPHAHAFCAVVIIHNNTGNAAAGSSVQVGLLIKDPRRQAPACHAGTLPAVVLTRSCSPRAHDMPFALSSIITRRLPGHSAPVALNYPRGQAASAVATSPQQPKSFMPRAVPVHNPRHTKPPLPWPLRPRARRASALASAARLDDAWTRLRASSYWTRARAPLDAV